MRIKKNASPGKNHVAGRGKSALLISIVCALIAGYFNSVSSYYTTSGQNIVDRETRKQVVIPHGVGIGGWLEPEGYMWGSGQYDSPRKIEKAISDLIGPAAADSFWILYHWNFFNETDVKACKGWGMNAIRIPLAAGMIQLRDSQPSAPPYKYSAEGWRILDSLVTWCERWQLGLIWDMHCAPGSQNGQNISDVDPSINKATLWSDTAKFWPLTRDLWFKIADRYKAYKCVIGYDLLNEPLLSNLGFNSSLLRKIYVSLTDTIRKVDTVGIIFVEGQWWARDITILEPINWDKHLVIAHHEYPPVVSCDGMKGSSNGNTWDVCASRTRNNVPIWHGETGEQGPPYSRNIQSTDFLNANNIGYAWWCQKKFNSQNAPYNCPKTSGFNSVLSYWNGGSKPSASDAKTWLFDQARRTATSFCTFNPDMVKSLHPLDPNGKVPVMQTVVPGQASETFFSNKAGVLSFSFPVGQRFSVEILDVRGRSVFSTTTSGKKFEIIGARFPAGVYVVRVAGEKTALQPRMVVLHP
jgi:aryl-phospho-beta-D-glucosidase BglC (GH1 family)